MKFPDMNNFKHTRLLLQLIWVATVGFIIVAGVILASVSKEKTKMVGAEKSGAPLYSENQVIGLEQTSAEIQLMKRRFEDVLKRSSGQEAAVKDLGEELSDMKGKVADLESRLVFLEANKGMEKNPASFLSPRDSAVNGAPKGAGR